METTKPTKPPVISNLYLWLLKTSEGKHSEADRFEYATDVRVFPAKGLRNAVASII
jgi:hypothetical protein